MGGWPRPPSATGSTPAPASPPPWARGARDDVVVLGLPRGGVVVAAEVARASAALDVLVVRKVGVPGHEELAAGAVASGGTTVVNEDVLVATGLGRPEMEQRAAERHRAVEEMEQRLRGDRAALDLAGKTAVLVDDGLATGATMRAAAVAARRAGAAWVVVAAPVASPEAVRLLESWPTRWSAPRARGPAGGRAVLPRLLARREEDAAAATVSAMSEKRSH